VGDLFMEYNKDLRLKELEKEIEILRNENLKLQLKLQKNNPSFSKILIDNIYYLPMVLMMISLIFIK